MEYTVEIPDGMYCEDCELFDSGQGYEFAVGCNLLKVIGAPIETLETRDGERVTVTLKAQDCPNKFSVEDWIKWAEQNAPDDLKVWRKAQEYHKHITFGDAHFLSKLPDAEVDLVLKDEDGMFPLSWRKF